MLCLEAMRISGEDSNPKIKIGERILVSPKKQIKVRSHNSARVLVLNDSEEASITFIVANKFNNCQRQIDERIIYSLNLYAKILQSIKIEECKNITNHLSSKIASGFSLFGSVIIKTRNKLIISNSAFNKELLVFPRVEKEYSLNNFKKLDFHDKEFGIDFYNKNLVTSFAKFSYLSLSDFSKFNKYNFVCPGEIAFFSNASNKELSMEYCVDPETKVLPNQNLEINDQLDIFNSFSDKFETEINLQFPKSRIGILKSIKRCIDKYSLEISNDPLYKPILDMMEKLFESSTLDFDDNELLSVMISESFEKTGNPIKSQISHEIINLIKMPMLLRYKCMLSWMNF